MTSEQETLGRHDERIKNIESQLPKIWEEIALDRANSNENWKQFFETQSNTKIQVALISGSVSVIITIMVAYIKFKMGSM